MVEYYQGIIISRSLLAKLPKAWCIFMEDCLEDMQISTSENDCQLWNLLEVPGSHPAGRPRASSKRLI